MSELRVLSLGWGVQSFTLAAMSALGELPKLDVIIHADTSWERKATYEFAAKWQPWLESKGMLVITATSLHTRYPQLHKSNIDIPAFFQHDNGDIGRINRQCTGYWKIAVVRTLINQELQIRGLKKSFEIVEQWLGISWDEASRASTANGVKYIKSRWPFLEKETRMKRTDCINWLTKNGLPIPPKSRCKHCSYQGQKDWENQKRNDPDDWNDSVSFDQSIRNLSTKRGRQLFVHRSARPLSEVVFLPEEAGYSQTFLPMDGPGCDTAGYCWD